MTLRSILLAVSLLFHTTVSADVVERVQYLMGTTARVTIEASDAASCERAVDAVFAAFHRVDTEMSTYRPDSDLSVLNRDGSREWVSISSSLVNVLDSSFAYHRVTDGAFDPSVFPLMVLWGFRGGDPVRPSAEAIARTLVSVGLPLVTLDVDSGRARFRRDGVSLDLGGIAKGYALDLGKRAAIEAGAEAGQLDLGGNLIVFGEQAAGEVGIQDPRDRERLIGRIRVEDVSVATSGGYERFVTIEGQNYGHIIDPRTGHPVDRVASATIVAVSGTAADALSTACAVIGREGCLELVEAREGVEAVVVWYEGETMRMARSSGLEVLNP